MHRIIQLLCLSVTFSITQLTFAASSYIYGGAKAGWNYFAYSCHDDATSCKDNDFAWGAFAGFTSSFGLGLELGYLDLGKVVAHQPSIKLTGEMETWDLSLTYNQRFARRWYWFGKAGAAFWNGEINGSGTFHKKGQGTSLLVGGGLEYRLSEGWTSRLEYDYIDGVGNGSLDKANTHTLLLGLHYRFTLGKERSRPSTKPKKRRKPLVTPIAPPSLPPPPPPKPVNPEGELLLRLAHFETAKAAPNQDEALRKSVEVIKSKPNEPVHVIGHTDSRGSPGYNLKLSKERAQKVSDHLIREGVDPKRITTEGRGEAQPIEPNATAEGRAANRRVEIRLGGEQ